MYYLIAGYVFYEDFKIRLVFVILASMKRKKRVLFFLCHCVIEGAAFLN